MATQASQRNSTNASNSTLNNSTAVATLVRSNDTVSILPPDAVAPDRNSSTSGMRKGLDVARSGNLQRAAQVILDLAGLTYAAAAAS